MEKHIIGQTEYNAMRKGLAWDGGKKRYFAADPCSYIMGALPSRTQWFGTIRDWGKLRNRRYVVGGS